MTDERIETWAEIARFLGCSERKVHSKLKTELTTGGFVWFQNMRRMKSDGTRKKCSQVVAVTFKSSLMQYLALKAEKKETV